MRIAIIIVSIMALAAILLKSGVITTLIMFIIAGAVPSTTLVFSPSTMLLIVSVVGWLLLVQVLLSITKLVRKQRQDYLSTYRHSPALRRRSTGRREPAT